MEAKLFVFDLGTVKTVPYESKNILLRITIAKNRATVLPPVLLS